MFWCAREPTESCACLPLTRRRLRPVRYRHPAESLCNRRAANKPDPPSQQRPAADHQDREMTCDIRNNHPARPLPSATCSRIFLAHLGEVGQELSAFQHFCDRLPFLKQRSSWTYVDAFAATSAGFGRTPPFCQVGDDERLNA